MQIAQIADLLLPAGMLSHFEAEEFSDSTNLKARKINPKDIIKSDYKFIAQGVKLTAEFADFLKG